MIPKKTIFLVSACIIVAATTVVVLTSTAESAAIAPQDFKRTYLNGVISDGVTYDLTLNSFYMAGVGDDGIYLGNYTTPFSFFRIDFGLRDTTQFIIQRDSTQRTLTSGSQIKVMSPFFYIADGGAPKILKGKLPDLRVKEITAPYFYIAEPFDSSSFVLRTNSMVDQSNQFAILTNKIRTDSTILEKQNDGVFCTDGLLAFNHDKQKLIFSYYYRNEFIICDTGLHVLNRWHTLDTFRHVNIRYGSIKSDNQEILTFKQIVNDASCTAGDYFYVCSKVPSKYETKETRAMKGNVDIYHIDTGKYCGTLSLYAAIHGKVKEMRIHRNHLVILHDNKISVFKLSTGQKDEIQFAAAE